MNYQVYLLNRLLDKYENSEWYYKGTSSRRVLLDPYKEKKLSSLLENFIEKKKFLSDLRELQSSRIIDFSWSKYEENNLVEHIWIQANPNTLQKAYSICNRLPKNLWQQQVINWLTEEKKLMNTLWIEELLEMILKEANEKGNKWSFNFSEKELRDICKVLRLLNQFKGEPLNKRILSTRVFADSKYFEKNVQRNLLQLVNYYLMDEDEEYTDKEKLQQLGIGGSPEIFYFSGPFQIHFNQGKVEGNIFAKGMHLGANMLPEVNKIQGNYEKVISIENLANYYWYVEHEKKGNEFVFYTGGFLTKNQTAFCNLIDMVNVKEVYHWGDIDLGGFRILNQIKKIWAEAVPWKMDIETLERYTDQTKIVGKEYIQKVKAALLREEYQEYRDVLKRIIDTQRILEQEAQILYFREDSFT